MRSLRGVIFSLSLTIFLATNALAGSATCQGKFFNPITDICWSCIYPLTIGTQEVFKMDQDGTQDLTDSNPVCGCLNPLRAGIKAGFWEPVRIVEVSRGAFCFHALGGLSIDAGVDVPTHTQSNHGGNIANQSFYQAHWYTSPLLYWLEVLLDSSCLETGVFDLAYFTEVDPTWADSELTFILNADVVLFANPVAQSVCAADCIAANFGFGVNDLFWCAGCQGSMYPLTGYVGSHIGGVQASSLIVQRLTNKMHREGLMWGAKGEAGMCGYYMQPLMDKTNYKYQMTYPVAQTEKINGKCCQPYGRSSLLWGSGKEIPFVGEDFVYQIFRKRDCCAAYKF